MEDVCSFSDAQIGKRIGEKIKAVRLILRTLGMLDELSYLCEED